MVYGSGNPLYDEYAARQFKIQTERGPGSAHRRQSPGLEDLTEQESNALRLILSRYDRRYNVTKASLPESYRDEVDKLEGLGFIRVEPDGRIVPEFVFQEHGRPIFKTEEYYRKRNKQDIERGSKPRKELRRRGPFMLGRAPKRLTA